MTKKIKILLSIIVMAFYYAFDAVIYPRMQEVYALQQAENASAAFVGLQTVQGIYTWIMPILFVLLIVIWFKEIKGLFKRFTN